uniref:SRCR domain-containing protein n=1 Tax=Neogobius melanostomus TaxID=47308 RepID=A0A8C6TPT7_9GOBI
MSFCIFPDSDDVRLVGGASHCEGELQVKHLNRWREVYIEDFLLLTAAGVCQRLHCGSAISHERKDRSSHSAVKLDADCLQSSSSLSLCVRDEDFSSDRYYSIICSDSVRLLHGSSQCSGSLEVKMNQSWTLVCAEDFDLKDVEVVCRELGCGDPSLLQGTFYGEGFAPVRQMFQCEGHESALMDCPRSSVIQNNCTSFKAVVLSCLGKPNYLMLLWLVPAVTVIIVAVIVLIVCKRKKSSSNAQGTTRRFEPCNPENVEYDNASMFEDHIYQGLSPGTMEPEYVELHQAPPRTT